MTDAPIFELAEDGVVLLPMDPFLESWTSKEELRQVLDRFSTEVKDLSR